MALGPTTDPLWQLQLLLCVRPGAGHQEKTWFLLSEHPGCEGTVQDGKDRQQNRNLYNIGWDMITSSGADQVMELLLNNEEDNLCP